LENTEQQFTPADDFDVRIRREWLITNGLGGYASGTVLGIPTRRYHGLLVSAARPPLERWLLLSSVLERLDVAGRIYETASFEFPEAVHPKGFGLLGDFEVSNNPQAPWARFVYRHEDVQLTKMVILPRAQDEVVIRYKLTGPTDARIKFELCPFVAMRDFHGLTHAFDPGFAVERVGRRVVVSGHDGWPRVWFDVQRVGGGERASFRSEPEWWYSFLYREESARGHEDREDLFVPGWFEAGGTGTVELELSAVADFSGEFSSASAGPRTSSVQVPEPAEQTVEDRLCRAADAFVVTRRCTDGRELATILAGYHWFGDWGRDTFISLPGLLLEARRFDEARQVLEVFALAQQDGLIPNRFSDYGEGRDYNSVDASLWFMYAAMKYLEAAGDESFWRTVLAPVCERIVQAFVAGTVFNIHVDEDGLLACGDDKTQLTWMDAKCQDVVFTPRHGKPVEINALWYHALCALSERLGPDSPQSAKNMSEQAAAARSAFVAKFWNERERCLYDVVRDDWRDLAVRPNQIFAVSLPHSPLDDDRKRAVLECVQRNLLTPFGLRSLGPGHPSYRGRYEGGPFERDSVYHQGTVWAWLMGPFVEAYLRVNDFSVEAKSQMRGHLTSLIEHLDRAGIGFVSEIFDGDEPHMPRGCIAQAWSVAELLRAWRMTAI